MKIFKYKLLRLVLMILVMIMSLYCFVNAEDYYVDTGGSNTTGNGSQGNPWQTIEYAFTQVSYGDLIKINDGVYSEEQLNVPLGVSLTAVNQVYPNPTVKISAVSGAQRLFYLVSSPPVKNGNHEISYIDIDGGPVRIYYGIQVTDRSNIHIHHCYLHDVISSTLWTRAIRITSSEADAYGSDWWLLTPLDGRDLNAWHAKWTFTPVENIEIDHCTIIDWGRIPTDGKAGTGGILPRGWKGGSIHDCYFEATDSSYYIKFIQATGGYIENVDIYNNIIRSHNKGAAGSVWSIEIWGHINTRLYNNDVNLPFSWTYGYGSEVFNNTLNNESAMSVGIEGIGQSNYKVYNNCVSIGADGGINCGHGGHGNLNHTMGNIEIFNNVVKKVWYKPICIYVVNRGNYNKKLYNVKIYNNTSDEINHYGMYLKVENSGGGTTIVDGVEFKNNIVTNAVEAGGRYYNDGNGGVLQNYVIDHNMYYNCGTNGFSGLTETNKLVDDPLFVDPANGDYHLQEGSPAIDAGIDVGLPYYGSAPDMGAYEYQQVGVDEKYQGYIYPNHCLIYMGVDYITFSNISSGNNIAIFDISGKIIHNSESITNNTYIWSVKNVSSGVYFYKIAGSNKASGKIVIIR